MTGQKQTPSLLQARECDRCPGVQMTLGPFYEGSRMQAWYCPCCKSKLRTGEMLQAEWDAQAADLGLTPEEWEAQQEARFGGLVATPTDRDLEAARSSAKTRAEEWTPACVHDTENPWTT